jgi:hypothetical protein
MTSVSFALLLPLSSLAVHKGSELTEFERNGAEEEADWRRDVVRPFAALVTQQRGWDVWLWPFTNLWVGPRCLSWSVGWGGKGDEGEQGKGREGSGVLLKSLK